MIYNCWILHFYALSQKIYEKRQLALSCLSRLSVHMNRFSWNYIYIYIYIYIGHKFYFILPAGESKPFSGSHSVAALVLTSSPIWSSFFRFIYSFDAERRPSTHSSLQLLLLLPSLFSFLLFFLYGTLARFRAMTFPLTGFPDNWTEVKILALHPCNFCINTNLSNTDVIFMLHCLLGSSSVFTFISGQFKHECNNAYDSNTNCNTRTWR